MKIVRTGRTVGVRTRLNCRCLPDCLNQALHIRTIVVRRLVRCVVLAITLPLIFSAARVLVAGQVYDTGADLGRAQGTGGCRSHGCDEVAEDNEALWESVVEDAGSELEPTYKACIPSAAQRVRVPCAYGSVAWALFFSFNCPLFHRQLLAQ